MSDGKVTYVKCKGSASLQPNNFTASKDFCAYIHRNEVHVFQNNNETLMAERANSKVCIYNDKGVVTEARLVEFQFGPALVVVTQGNVQANVLVYDPEGQKLLSEYKTNNKAPKDSNIRGIATDEKTLLFVGVGSGEVLVLKVGATSMSLDQTLLFHDEPVSACAFSAGILATGDERGSVALWKNGTKIKSWEGQGHPCTSLCAGQGYAVGGFSTGHIRMYHLERRELHVEICAHTRTISGVCMHPQRALVGVCSEDTFIGIWSMPDGSTSGVRNVLQVSPSPFLITGVQFVGDRFGKIGCTAYDSRYISLLDIP